MPRSAPRGAIFRGACTTCTTQLLCRFTFASLCKQGEMKAWMFRDNCSFVNTATRKVLTLHLGDAAIQEPSSVGTGLPYDRYLLHGRILCHKWRFRRNSVEPEATSSADPTTNTSIRSSHRSSRQAHVRAGKILPVRKGVTRKQTCADRELSWFLETVNHFFLPWTSTS